MQKENRTAASSACYSSSLQSHTGGLWVGEETTTKTNFNLTQREAHMMDMMPVQHIPFASSPSTAVEQHLGFGDDW